MRNTRTAGNQVVVITALLLGLIGWFRRLLRLAVISARLVGARGAFDLGLAVIITLV